MTKIYTYRQDLPAEFLRDHPKERWRCDISPGKAFDHHGVGETEAEALLNAALQWRKHESPASEGADHG